jgi:hypothetical protein
MGAHMNIFLGTLTQWASCDRLRAGRSGFDYRHGLSRHQHVETDSHNFLANEDRKWSGRRLNLISLVLIAALTNRGDKEPRTNTRGHVSKSDLIVSVQN